MRDDERDPDHADTPESGTTGRGVTDSIRRLVMGGMGSLLTTEEGLRAGLSELKLPKEVVSFLMQQAEKTKVEVVKVLAREIRGFLENIDAQGLVQKAITNMVIEVNAEIRFKPAADGSLQSNVKVDTTRRTKSQRGASRRAPRRKPRAQ